MISVPLNLQSRRDRIMFLIDEKTYGFIQCVKIKPVVCGEKQNYFLTFFSLFNKLGWYPTVTHCIFMS